MSKKKREHVVFDQVHKVKKSVPFAKVNKSCKTLIDRKKQAN